MSQPAAKHGVLDEDDAFEVCVEFAFFYWMDKLTDGSLFAHCRSLKQVKDLRTKKDLKSALGGRVFEKKKKEKKNVFHTFWML
jgi:hypothetical protein